MSEKYAVRLTIGQSVFVVLTLLFAGFLDFYFGARFGPEIFWNIRVDGQKPVSLLPEEISEDEIIKLLEAEGKYELSFYEALEKGDSLSHLMGKVEGENYGSTPSIKTRQDETKNSDEVVKTHLKTEEKKQSELEKVEEEKKAEPEVVEKKEVKPEVKTAETKKTAATVVQEPVITPKPENKEKPLPPKEESKEKPKEKISVAAVVKPEPLQEEKKEETPPPVPDEGSSLFTLQVGSYPSFKKAEDILNRFKGAGYSARVDEVDLREKGKKYRVQIGRFHNVEEAENGRERIQRIFGLMAAVVRVK